MLSTQPYKGVRDFFPQDIKVRNYIFETWRKVCLSFGFEEYDGPFLEPFEIYAAKTGEEIVNEQLYYFTDKGERKVAIRPEMTPTVSRMAAAKIQEGYPTPIKWFSIANFYRYEKPQKGRLREFFQLNVDIFGEEAVEADFEILLLNKALMDAFGAKQNMYKIKVNNRYLINYLFNEVIGLSEEQMQPVAKAIDKMPKVSKEDFEDLLKKSGLSEAQIKKINEILKYTVEDVRKIADLPKGAQMLPDLFKLLETTDIKNVVYDPTIVRGFDYYDGNVFEQFDMTEGNTRSMFGGGRYDGLISLFIERKIAATGFAPGDVTLLDFLESWDLLPKFENNTKVLVTVFPENEACYEKSLNVADELRKNLNVETYLNPLTDLSKQIKYADKKQIPFVVVIGPDELEKETVTLKNMQTGEQKAYKSAEELLKDVTN